MPKGQNFPQNNPYNFVPGDTQIKEHPQAPKLSRFEGLSGWIECSLINETLLMVASGDSDESRRPLELEFFKINGKLAIPGTSLKGMIRSVLEAVTNACFSVFDGDRLDYRTPHINLKAGQIIRMPQGNQPGQLRQMQRGWIAMPGRPNTIRSQGTPYTLARVPSNTESGQRVWIKYVQIPQYTNSRGRSIPGPFYLITAISIILQPGFTEGIYKITGQSINNKKRERVFFSLSGGAIYTFSQQEVEDYNYVLKKQLERHQSQGGFDLLERNKLSERALVYFQPQPGNNAKFISRIEIPRLRYANSRKDLLPKEYHKCTDPNNLCAACRLFGFVEGDEKLTGRISITDAEDISGGGESQDYLDLKILGTPHPTSYNFYLIDPTNPSTVRNYDGCRIVNNRGKIDESQKGPVQLRGRKFYYHHPSYINRQRYCCNPNETSPELYSRVKPVLENNTFRFKIYFRNLSEFELGLLIYCLELEGKLKHKLGMGKPIGFGTVKITIDSLKVEDNSRSKYLDLTHSGPKEKKSEVANYKTNFKNQVAQMLGKPFDQLKNVQKLKNILDPSRSPSNIGYPQEGFQWYMNHRNTLLPPL